MFYHTENNSGKRETLEGFKHWNTAAWFSVIWTLTHYARTAWYLYTSTVSNMQKGWRQGKRLPQFSNPWGRKWTFAIQRAREALLFIDILQLKLMRFKWWFYTWQVTYFRIASLRLLLEFGYIYIIVLYISKPADAQQSCPWVSKSQVIESSHWVGSGLMSSLIEMKLAETKV